MVLDQVRVQRQMAFKLAAERLNETREERDKLQRIVSDSESVEIQLRNLTTRRAHKQEDLADATRLVEDRVPADPDRPTLGCAALGEVQLDTLASRSVNGAGGGARGC